MLRRGWVKGFGVWINFLAFQLLFGLLFWKLLLFGFLW